METTRPRSPPKWEEDERHVGLFKSSYTLRLFFICKIHTTIEDLLDIWIPDGKTISGTTSIIVWLEKGTKKAGLTHIIENHHKEFDKKNIPVEKLADVAKAATTVGTEILCR